MYDYAANNPVRYIDPDGNDILPITSRQYQNSALNINLDIGSESTGFYDSKKKYIHNTIGRFGCLFVCVVNVGNSYNQATLANYSEQLVSSLSNKDSYFNFFLSSTNLGTDFSSDSEKIGALLKDMTGKEFNVMRIRHKSITIAIMEAIKSESSKSSYVIADVGGHFINITGIDNNGKIEYFDPYIRKAPKEYTLNDIKGAYFIMEIEAYKKMEAQNEKE